MVIRAADATPTRVIGSQFSEHSYLAVLAASLVLVKGLILVADPIPRLFMGDSGTYLWTAVSGAIPTDRSFTYGLLIPFLSLGTGDLRVVVAVQALASAASAWLMAVVLRQQFGATRNIASAAAVAISLEPLQLAYERFILTEALAMLVLATLLSIPLTWLVAVALPFLAWPRLRDQRPGRRSGTLRMVGTHVAVSLIATGAAHTAYRQIFAALTATPPGYQNATGLFAIAAFAPLVKRSHFPDTHIADEVLGAVEYPMQDPARREDQRWEPGGLVRTLERKVGSELEADRVARQIAWRIALDDPLGVVRIGAGTLGSYFVGPKLRAGLDYDLGPKTLPGGLEGLRPFDASFGAATIGPSLTRAWHRAAWWWYPALLLCPAAAMIAAFACPAAFRSSFAFLGMVSGTLVVTGPFLATMPVVRHLHPLSWMTTLVIAAALGAMTSGGRQPARIRSPLEVRRQCEPPSAVRSCV